MPPQKTPDDQLALDLELANDLKAVTAPAPVDDLEADLSLANDLLAVQQPAARPAPMSAHGWTDPASVKVTNPPNYVGPTLTGPGLPSVNPKTGRPMQPVPYGRGILDMPLTEGIAQAASGAITLGPALMGLTKPEKREGILAASDLLEGVFKAAQPLIAGGLVTNPVGTTTGLIKAAIADRLGAEAAEAVGASEDVSRLAGQFSAAVSGGISVRQFAEGSMSTAAKIMADAAKARGRALALAAKLAQPGQGPSSPYPGVRTTAAFEEPMVERAAREASQARAGALSQEAAQIAAEATPPPPRGPQEPPRQVADSQEAIAQQVARVGVVRASGEAPLSPEQQQVREALSGVTAPAPATDGSEVDQLANAVAQVLREGGAPVDRFEAAASAALAPPAPAEPPAALDADLQAADTALAVEAARTDVNTQPTDGQKEAGNYKKGHVKIHGLDITIENPVGSLRTGTSPDGEAWSVQMPADYGYIKRTEGADGDNVDVYIGPNHQSQNVFVIDQVNPDTGVYDEHKAIMGVDTPEQARALYEAGFSDGRGAERIGGITRLPVDEFRLWAKRGNTKKPLAIESTWTKREEPATGESGVPVVIPQQDRETTYEGWDTEDLLVEGHHSTDERARAQILEELTRRGLTPEQIRGEEPSGPKPVGSGKTEAASNSEFLKIYEEQLRLYHAKGQYNWMIDAAPLVAQKMQQALADGSANTDGSALKATAKRLGIKNTNKAWREYFAASPVAQAAVPAPGQPEPKQPFGYDEWAAQYREAFKWLNRYTPDQVGSQIYAEQMAKLADENPDYLEEFERQEAAAQAKPADEDDEDVQAEAYAAKTSTGDPKLIADVEATAARMEARPDHGAEPTAKPEPAQTPDRPRRNAVDSNRLEDDLSQPARDALAAFFKQRTRSRDLRHIREAMEVYERLHEMGEDGADAAKTLRATTNAFFLNQNRDTAAAMSDAAWVGLQTITGEDDPDPAELLENEVFASAREAGELIFQTLDPKTATFDVEEFNTAYGDVEFRREPNDVFPAPKRVVNLRTAKLPKIAQAEADRIIANWKWQAKKLGEMEDNSRRIVYSLFDVSGVISQPWRDAGYTVRQFDIKKGEDLMDFGSWMEKVEEDIAEGFEIVGVLAQPPCTSFAVSGARWWATQHDVPNTEMVRQKYGLWASEMFDTPLDYANHLVAVVKLFVAQADPKFYVMENPVGRINTQNNLPKPTLVFDPANFGNPYTKQTQLWGEFNADLPTANVEATLGSLIHKLRGDVEEQKAQRSVTPEGFAYAFFVANRKAAAAGVESTQEDTDDRPDDADGRPAATSQPDEPVGGAGADRPVDVAGEPAPGGGVQEPASKPKRPRTRSPRKGGTGESAGVATPGGGAVAGGSAVDQPAAHVDTADAAPDDDVADAHARGEAPRFFTIENVDVLTEGAGWVGKLDANMTALRLLKQLQAEGRPATDAEQAVLARYIGWGHTELAPIVDLQERLSDGRKTAARQELESLLTARELQTVGLTTPNAHYSFHDLPVAMWELAERLGFKGGTVLEPAIGTGHFIGTMPGPIRAHKRTRVFGVDMEPIAAGIAQQLYQGARIQNSPLQEAVLPENYFDIAISNVPFGRIRVFDPAFVSADRAAMTRSVHNYYFGKALDLVRPGGLVLFVTSRFTMDSRNDSVRKYLDQRAIFLGAIRLPNKAFDDTAGTEVVTDVIVLQRRGDGVTTPSAGSWLAVGETAELKDKHGYRPTTFEINEYFLAHPEMVLGKQDATGKMARTSDPQYNVVGSVTPHQLSQAVANFRANVYKPTAAKPRKIADTAQLDARQGSFVVQDGKLYTFDKGTLEESTLKGKNLERALAFVPLRDAYLAVLDANVTQADDATLAAAQKKLRKQYDTFVKAFGFINTAENRVVLEADPNAARIVTLEDVEYGPKEKGKRAQVRVKGLADIFAKRLMSPPKEPTTAAGALDALVTSRAWRGRVDLDWMAQLTGRPVAELTKNLSAQNELFQDPVTGAWEPRDEYLSGDVVTKIAQAKAAADNDKQYVANLAALEAVAPTPLTIDDFYDGGLGRSAPFGATWVPAALFTRFLEDTGGSQVQLRLLNTDAKTEWYVDAYGNHEFRPPSTDYQKWVHAALNGRTPKVTVKDADGTERIDPELTLQLQQSVKQLREQWSAWWKTDATAAEQIVAIYNAMFNREVATKVDGRNLLLPNANPGIVLREGQKDSIARTLNRGNTYLAQAVGWGKTYEMIAIASEWKRRGLASKVMIVVPNHLVEQWRRDFISMYPAARVLMTTKEDYKAGARKRLIARIANNDWDAVVVGQSQFLRIGVKIETLRAFIDEQEQQLLAEGAAQLNMSVEDFSAAVDEYGAGGKKTAITGRGAPRSAKDIARQILNLRAQLQKRLNAAAKDPIEFETLGVDALIVDEAHEFKNLYFSSSHNNIAGLKGSASDKALDMYLKVRLINEQSGQRNVVFASATPISNTMSELYTAFRYLDMKGLRRLGIGGFDSWMSGYATADGKLEPTAAGGFKERVRLRTWTNGQELHKLFSRFADVITREEVTRLGLLKLPKENTVTVSTDPPPEMPAFMATIKQRAEMLATGKVNPKDDNHLWVSSHASLAAIDLRLVPARFGGLPANAPVNPNGRISSVAREVVKRYKASQATKGTQLVFLDIGVPKGDAIPPLPASVLNTKAEEVEETEEDAELTGEAEPEPDDDALGAVSFNLYGELTANLVKAGIKRDEIAYIHQATTPHELGKLFTAVQEGTIRVLLSTRAKGGTGMNVQHRIVAIHHVDVPWRPDQLEQANGRGIRQLNTNDEVDIVKYVTPGSYDQYRWYLLGIKQGFISRFLKGEVGNMEDIDPQQLDMEMAAALGSGDSRVLELINTERDIQGLRARAQNWRLRNDAAKREVGSYKRMIEGLEAELAETAPTRAKLDAWVEAGKPVVIDTTVGGSNYYRSVQSAKARTFKIAEKDGRDDLTAALPPFMDLGYMPTEGARIGSAGPYDLRVLPIERRETRIVNGNMETNEVRSAVLAVFHDGKMVGHTPEWNKDEPPDLVRSLIYHTGPDRIDAKATVLKNGIASHKTNLANAERIAGKSFDQSTQLEMAEQKLTELKAALDGSQRPAKTEEPSEDDQPTSGASGGSVGSYAQQAAAGQPNSVQPIQFPELVELARELQATPSVVRAFRNDQKRGQFSERGIRLRADLFKKGNEFQLAATLAHEIGHLIDWLPSRSLKRGNLIGRLFSLRAFMKWKFNAPDGSTIHNKEIKAELLALSDAWRPWDRTTATDSFRKYRESSRELYADALSVLLNDPQKLEAEAPIFFKQFFDGLDQKPEVKAAYFDLQTTLAGTPSELTARRRAGVRQMFTVGDTKAMDLERQRQAEKKLQRKEFWQRLRAQHVDKHAPIIDKVRELERATLQSQGTRLNPDDDPRYALEERNYLGGKLKAFTDKNFLPIYQTLTEAKIDWHEFGEALFYERIIAGDRSELANPRGISPTVASELLLSQFNNLTAAQRPIMRAQIDAFRKVIKDVAGDAYQAGLYTDALYQQMQANPAYVSFRVIEHIDKDVTSRVYRQIGTLKDITNPADASMLKVLVTLRAIEHNKVKKVVFDFLEKYSPDAIEQAKEVWNGKGHRPIDPKDHDRRMITYFVAGRLRGKYVPHAIADSLENESVGGNMAIVAGLRWMNSGLFRPVFTSFNAGFQTYNFARDFLRFWKNTPTMTVGRALRRYYQAVPLARVRAFGINERGASMKLRLAHKELIQAEEAGLLSVTFNDLSKGRHVEDTQVEDTLQRMGVGGFSAAKQSKGLARILKPIVTWMTEVGDFIETLPKAAALYEYKGAGTIAEIPADVRSFIRRKIGSPDYLAGGTHKPITNELFLFSNAITQALRADYEVATEGAPVPPKPQAGGGSGGSGTPPPNSGNTAGPTPFDRANFWWKTAATNIAPKLWWFAVLYLLTKDGDDPDSPMGRLRRMARAVSEYDMTNYLVVPLGIDGKGNVTYLRVPQDDSGRLLGGLAWKLLRAASGDKDVWKSAMQVFDYTAGQMPGLTPSLGALSDLAQMASGRNVYDPFRSRFLFTDDEMKAGGWQKAKKFIGYEFQELGGGVIWKFYAGEQRPRERTTGQVILDLPILSNVLGRWIKISNYGEVERLREVQGEQQGDEARARLAERAAVNQALKDYRALPAAKKNREALVAATDAIVAKLYADLPGAQRVEKGRRILTKLKMGNTRASSDALLDVVMSATSNAQKVAVIKEAAKGMSKEELTGWVNQAAGAGAISGQVRADVLRNVPPDKRTNVEP